jgi:hypothetical protein
MSWSNKNFAISSRVWIGGHITISCSRRIEFQNDLTAKEYASLMNDNIEDLTELRLWSLEKITENKAKVARAYNKKVKLKEFQVGDLVWEVVLPLGTKGATYGKWSPNWHGPYRIDKSYSETHICLRSWTVSSSQ